MYLYKSGKSNIIFAKCLEIRGHSARPLKSFTKLRPKRDGLKIKRNIQKIQNKYQIML